MFLEDLLLRRCPQFWAFLLRGGCLALGCVKKQHKEQEGCSHDTVTVILWLKRGQVTDLF